MKIDILCPLYNAGEDFEMLMKGINTQKDIEESRRELEAMGFSDFDCFEYITPNGE